MMCDAVGRIDRTAISVKIQYHIVGFGPDSLSKPFGYKSFGSLVDIGVKTDAVKQGLLPISCRILLTFMAFISICGCRHEKQWNQGCNNGPDKIHGSSYSRLYAGTAICKISRNIRSNAHNEYFL